jgi:pyroglutamyl-peptidase
MALATMIEGVRAAIECAITVRDDLGTSGGTTH